MLKTSLKTGLLALEHFIHKKYEVLFIADIANQDLFTKFYFACKKKNIPLLKKSDVALGFLTTRRSKKVVVVTLFLTPLRAELIQKETALTGVPVITFGSLLTSRNSSLLHIGGNFTLHKIQNLILTLLTICLEKKNVTA